MSSSFVFVFVSVICGVGGQVVLKLGMARVGAIGDVALAQPLALALRVVTTPLVVAGLALYVLGAVSWLTVLSRLPLSAAYPFLAVGYVLTPLLAWLFLRESVSPLRWVGILVISLGVILVSRG